MPQYDLSKPYIGYRSAGRRPEANNDRTAAANAPLSALRGWAAGTAGLPGDIEGLLRSGLSQLPPQLLTAFPALRAFGIGSRADPTPQLPTTDFYNEYLPGANLNQTPTGKAFTSAGNLLGGTGATSIARLGIKSTAGLADLAAKIAAESPRSGSRAAQLGVIKLPGAAGNFLKDNVENSLKGLKTDVPAFDFSEGRNIKQAESNFIEQNFPGINQEYSDAFRASGMHSMHYAKNQIPWLKENHPEIIESLLTGKTKDQALNNWIDKQLTRYIKNDMATSGDPIRALAERGITHAEIPPTTYDIGSIRKELGFPEEGMGVSPQAKAWESRSDSVINTVKASDMTDAHYPGIQIKNPWLFKVPPETTVYSLYTGSNSDLGFQHLIDELRNATDLASGLPSNLRLKSSSLPQLSVPQAVERVSQINAWRAAEAIKAEKAGMMGNLSANSRLEDPTTQLSFVDKPGMKWVDIPETTDKIGLNLCTTIGKQGGWCTQGEGLAKSYGSGPNRLTTLIDADGRPHAQAKITSGFNIEDAREAIDNIMETMSAAEQRKFNKYIGSDEFATYGEFDHEEVLAWLQSNMPKSYKRYLASVSGPPNITEIKPVENTFSSERALEYKSRDPQYQNKITNSTLKFLNSGEWGSVTDLDHFNIVDLKDTYSVQKALREILDTDLPKDRIDKFNYAVNFNPEANRFMSTRQFSEFLEPPEGFAKGGAVHMGIGGLLKLKNAVKGAQKVLPAAKREANLAKMLEDSKVKERLYHATPQDIKEFKPGGKNPKVSGHATWLSNDPKRQPAMHNISGGLEAEFREGTNVMPVYVQAKNPMLLDDKDMLEWAQAAYAGGSKEFPQLMPKKWADAVSKDYDSVILADPFGLGDAHEVIMFDPKKIKSAISNRGTYDITDPDIGKAKGGAVHMDEGGAAFGVFPQMKARRAQQDRTAAANAPLSALRGWAAGTAGLAGDIEGLARAGISKLPPQLLTAFPALRAFGIGSRADPTPQMPTTEFYNEYLPGAQLNATPIGKAFTTAGNLLGGAGSTTLARYGIKSAKATAKALGPTAVRIGEDYLERQGLMPGVIKPKGGNFLSGSVEESVRPMKRGTPSIAFSQEEADDLIARGFVRDKSGGEGYYLPLDPVNTFIDKKIAPYIRNEMATPDDPLRAMAEKYAVDKPVKLAEVQGRIDAFAAKMEQEARDRGVPVEMLTSMRQQMIGLEKEKALLEAREGLHSELFPPNPDDIQNLGDVRYAQGFEPGGMGQSEQARIWEDLADVAFDEPSQAGSRWGEATLQTDPWLRKVPPETPVYGEYLSTNNLGFRHLVDELRNATNPASGLPANLLIDPADLGKFTMPQAVDRVADINAWRATQKIEANQAIANNAATFLHKDYPTIPGTDESNKLGLRWMQIRHDPSLDILPKSLKGKQEGDEYVIRNSKGQVMVSHDNYAYAFDDLKYNFPEYFKNDPLKKALKYEGDTMAHSVGGYATRGGYGAGGIDAILKGEASIYSLRDAKGQPQVTIETRPGYTIFDTGKPEGRPGPERIIQIKGKSNRKPADEYLPFVQDFVKSGNWSDVGDLQNAGLHDARAAGKAIEGRPAFMTDEELEAFKAEFAPKPEGMAKGGLVSNHFDPIKIKQIIAGLDDEYDPENIQQIIAQRESAYA